MISEEEWCPLSLEGEVATKYFLEVKLEDRKECWDEIFLKILHTDSNIDELKWKNLGLNEVLLEIKTN